MSWEAFHDDSGEHVGYFAEADDGAIIAADLDGQIRGAVAPDGTQLDPAGYEIADPEPARSQPSAAEIDALVQAEAAQQAAGARAWQQAQETATAQADLQRMQTDVIQQVESLQAQIGRQLTMAEMRNIGERLSQWMDAGRVPDAFMAVEQLEAEGKPLLDLDNARERQQWMSERLVEKQRVERGEDISEPPGPSKDKYDLSNHQDRVAMVMDKLDGHDTEGRTFDSRDAVEPG